MKSRARGYQNEGSCALIFKVDLPADTSLQSAGASVVIYSQHDDRGIAFEDADKVPQTELHLFGKSEAVC
ncbi:MAG: hypothetical protein OQL16_12420 [Gammaproteobacteria bacterium]|nr:hypothetical protein [Gammaproteobacteria bacterium]